MPVYGQLTNFNERLCSLMSSIVCNSNSIYEATSTSCGGGDEDGSSTNSKLSPLFRPLFTKAILQKAKTTKAAAVSSSSSPPPSPLTAAGAATNNMTSMVIVEIVIIVSEVSVIDEEGTLNRSNNNNSNNNKTVNLLAKFIQQLYSMPESNNQHLMVHIVRSNFIR